MPRLTKSVPKYRKHKATGQAVVTLNAKDFYLGPYGTKASKDQYDALIAEWMQNGRRLPRRQGEITIVELIAAYWSYAKSYYVKNGKPTDEQPGIKAALRYLRQMYGRESVVDFGPLSLKAVRQKMIEKGNCRKYINKNIGRIKRAFKWGVANELVPIAVYQSLTTVEGLRRGKTEAREPNPVSPVSEDAVEQVLKELPKTVADMVRIHRLTGCRPSEVCMMRPTHIDRTGEVWAYRPESHKTEHHDRERVIFIGSKAQQVLGPYLLRDADSFCFVPMRSWRSHFTKDSYRKAIHRACDRAEIERWNPNQLRHSVATEIRQRYGLEAAQVTLGHASADVSQIYAERDLTLAARIMKEVG